MNRDETLNRRLTLLSIGLIGISLVLLARLLSFQFRMNPQIKEALENQARSRYQQTVEVLPTRGQIFDRDGHLLATNSFEYRIGISPNQVLDRQDVAMKLAPLVGLSEDKLYRLLEPDANGTFPPYILLASRVSAEVGQAIADLDIDGIIIEPLPIRIYPQGSLMSQVVGIFAGADERHTGQGYYGVEGYYQTLLAGQSKRVTKSNIPLLEESQTKATRVRDGMSLVLTIDRDLQYLAQQVLTDFIEKDPTATGGTILIMNPRNGEILAMANYPPFDPFDLSPENLQRARNPAIGDIYEPGSVFKVLTMAIALDLGTHDLDWSYYDPGCFEAGGVAICNWDRTSHGNPDFAQVFIDSLNTGTATIYKEIGPYKVYPKLREFGIGSPTGVDLEGESPGILVEPGDPNWSEAQFLNNSYGQGVSVTPLQLLTAVNAIANDGLIMQPHIVKARLDGDQVVETQPAAIHRPISEETAHKARDIMVRVLRESKEIEFELPGYTVAGKTGTAEIPAPYGYEPFAPGNSIASFIAFLPANDPVVSILIKLDRPYGYWGSLTAAPLGAELLKRLVVLMEIPPDDVRYQLVAQGGNPFAREY
ncbi:MAG: peptidoglycan D,D-transpeptidase FtsI family protein [Aggregatilineaceae bacterium]